MKKAGEEIIMWFSESQLPRALPRFGPITSAGETRFGSFLIGVIYKKKFSQISDLEKRIPF